jgi:hypothetical protein
VGAACVTSPALAFSINAKHAGAHGSRRAARGNR